MSYPRHRTVRFPPNAMIATHQWRSGLNDKGGWELFTLPDHAPTRIPYFHERNVWIGLGLLAVKAHETVQEDPVVIFRHPRTYEIIAVLSIQDVRAAGAEHPDYLLNFTFALPVYRILLQKRLW